MNGVIGMVAIILLSYGARVTSLDYELNDVLEGL